MPETAPHAAKIFLLDDHPAVRHSLGLLFRQAGHGICGEAGTLREARQKLDSLAPEIVVMDISLGDENGLDLLAELKRRRIRALVYTMYGDAGIIESAMQAGADGYVTKRDELTCLTEALAALLAGQSFTSPCAAQSLAQKVLRLDGRQLEITLSEREKEIVELFRSGHTTIDIAAHLRISSRTVETYYGRIIEKLQLDGMKGFRRYVFGGRQ